MKPSIQLWNRNFESLIANKSDLIQANSATNFHLFSNILDIDTVDIPSLCDLILETQTGWNYFLCVSTTGRAAANASTRISQFYSHLCSCEFPIQMSIALGQYQTITPPILFINNNTTQSRPIRMFGGYFAIDFGVKNYINYMELYGINYKNDNTDTNKLQTQIAILNADVQERNAELKKVKQLVDNNNNQINQIKYKISQLTNELQTKNTQLANLQRNLSDESARVLQLEHDIDEKRILLEKSKKEIIEQTNQIDEIQEKLNNSKALSITLFVLILIAGIMAILLEGKFL